MILVLVWWFAQVKGGVGLDGQGACTVGELYALVASESGTIRTSFTSIEEVVAIMRDQCDTYDGNDFGELQTRTQINSPLDTDPRRLSEAWVNTWMLNRAINASCLSEYVLGRGSSYVQDNAIPARLVFESTSCIYNQSSNISDICRTDYPACPPYSQVVTHPIRVSDWNAVHGPTCPKFCLDPVRYDNLIDNWIMSFTKPIDLFVDDMLNSSYCSMAVALYFWTPGGTSRYAPSLASYNVTMADAIGYSFPLFWLDTNTPIDQANGILYTRPYQDPVTRHTMITLMLPKYLAGGRFIGMFCADMQLHQLTPVLASFSPTTSSMSIITINGFVIVALPSVLSALFCPGPNCDANGVYNLALGGQVAKLSQSPLDDVRTASRLIESQAIATVTIRAVAYYAVSVPVAGMDQWVLTTLVPSHEIDRAAVWQLTTTDAVLVLDSTSNVGQRFRAHLANKGLHSTMWVATVQAGTTAIASVNGTLPAGESTTISYDLVGVRDSRAAFLTIDVAGAARVGPTCFPPLQVKIPIEPQTIYETFVMDRAVILLVLSTYAITILFLSICAHVVWRFRTCTMMKASSPRFLMTAIAGAFLFATASLAFAVLPTPDAAGLIVCQARWWMTTFGFVTTFSPLFLKTYRIHKVTPTTRRGVHLMRLYRSSRW
ncbi:unnamed protein product (mitochondrion) [Plasmodiophora brassicae]|uniref:G-protein coupled receptors family 3 profile domain-containing protein n=1 Tax=Plasmodiophora brassicae TaxID=37360 RepID=A0A3P3YFD2_PLABS|nr:unnamed protein product [Plasmodiophora brassicae]